MKQLFLVLLILSPFLGSFAQDPYIDAGPDTLTCPPDCIDLEADYYGTGSTEDYTVETITYAPDSYAGTTVFLSDDGGATGLPIGFNFCFFGDTYSTFLISSNGWIGFGGLVGTWNCVAIPNPGGSVPKNCVMGAWHDLNPTLGGTVTYAVFGVAPFRRLVVTWQSVPHFSCGPGTETTQQIILYESTNIIENHIEGKHVCLDWAGGRAVQGLHNAAGSIAVTVPGRNNTVWSTENDAVRYVPSGLPEIEWYEEDLLIGDEAAITVCPEEPTTYVVKLLSCGVEIVSDTVFIDIECCDPPIMSFTEPSCFGACDGTATAEGVGVAPFTYQWDAATGDQTTPTAVDLCAGTYEVEVTDAEGCSTITEITVTEPDEIIGEFDEFNHISCFGETDGNVLIVATGGTGDITYDIGGGPMATGEFNDLVAGTYTVFMEDENGCTGEVEFEIIEPDPIEAVIVEVTDVLCNGESNGIVEVDGIGGTGDYEFQIDGGGFGPSGTFDGLPIGTYTFEIRDENGCSATIDTTINEPTPLILDIITEIHITCFEGSDGVIEVAGSGGAGDLMYSLDGGFFVGSGLFDGLEVGTYEIVVRDENNCETEIEIELTEPPAVDIDEAVTHETCEYDCTGAIEMTPVVGVAPFEYSINDCVTMSPSGTFTGLCDGTYDICVEDANGCGYTNTVNINLGAPPSSAVIFEFGRDFCLDDDPVPVFADSPGGVYTGPGMVGNVFYPSLAGVGIHTIVYEISEGCGDIGFYTLEVHALPYIAFSTLDTAGCEPLTVNFSYDGEAGIDCFWNFDDGTGSDDCSSVTHTYEDDGDYSVSLTVTTAANNCKSTLTKYDFIEVYNQPIADFEFEPQPTTDLKTEIEFTDLSFGPEFWEWTFDKEGSSEEQHPKFYFPREVAKEYDVMLVVSNSDGCIDSLEKTVVISPEYLIYVPNTITPDGDVFNEVFKPYFNGIDIYNYSLRIYNRWGELLFVSYDPSKGWNGTYGGEVVESGVYVWHISTDEVDTDKKIEHYGHVTVLR